VLSAVVSSCVEVTIRTELGGGATFTGTFSKDGNTGSGGWRPDEGKEGPGNLAYDITSTRVASVSTCRPLRPDPRGGGGRHRRCPRPPPRAARAYTRHPAYYGYVYPVAQRSREMRVICRIHTRRITLDTIHA